MLTSRAVDEELDFVIALRRTGRCLRENGHRFTQCLTLLVPGLMSVWWTSRRWCVAAIELQATSAFATEL